MLGYWMNFAKRLLRQCFPKEWDFYDSIIPFNRFLILENPKENQKNQPKKARCRALSLAGDFEVQQKIQPKNAMKIFRKEKIDLIDIIPRSRWFYKWNPNKKNTALTVLFSEYFYSNEQIKYIYIIPSSANDCKRKWYKKKRRAPPQKPSLCPTYQGLFSCRNYYIISCRSFLKNPNKK